MAGWVGYLECSFLDVGGADEEGDGNQAVEDTGVAYLLAELRVGTGAWGLSEWVGGWVGE